MPSIQIPLVLARLPAAIACTSAGENTEIPFASSYVHREYRLEP